MAISKQSSDQQLTQAQPANLLSGFLNMDVNAKAQELYSSRNLSVSPSTEEARVFPKIGNLDSASTFGLLNLSSVEQDAQNEEEEQSANNSQNSLLDQENVDTNAVESTTTKAKEASSSSTSSLESIIQLFLPGCLNCSGS